MKQASIPNVPVLLPCALLTLAAVCAYSVSGCASRVSATNRPTSTPTQPSESAEDREKLRPRERADESAPRPSLPAPAIAHHQPDKPAPILPGGALEEGNASWYGVPFHGRHASNGEIYDMHKLTAAHRTLPFDTVVRVTNLTNGKSTVVRITDRGPFVENRIIDLSMAAAREIESIGPGVVPVRLEILSAIDPSAGFFTVQVGAFRDRSNAEHLRDRLRTSYSPIFIQEYDSPGGMFYRVRIGKVPGEDAAHQFGDRLRSAEGFTPLVVRLDEAGLAGEHP